MNLLTHSLDYVCFALLGLAAFAALHLWRRRGGSRMGVPGFAWALVLALLLGGGYLTGQMGDDAQARVTRAVLGFAPTYAQEIERMGHARLTLATPPDDPSYLAIIEAEKRWLTVNPVVNDIYTVRRGKPGEGVLMADSETDYDRNGRYAGDREARTAIGEAYTLKGPVIEAAFAGTGGFDTNPTTDRWGSWVSAYWPLYAANGQVEAVLGVDYAAAEWAREINRARRSAMVITAVLLLMLFAATVLITSQRAELAARRTAEDALRKARDAAESASRLKSEFLACMSHEIRTPMNGVMGITELLLGTELSEKQRHYSDLIYRSATTLLNVINDILDYSKIEADKLIVEEIDFDPVELIEDIGELLASRAHSKGLDLNLEIPADSPRRVQGDPNRIRQVLTNLAGNAIKFTDRGEVTIAIIWQRTSNTQITLRCDVRDTGVGIEHATHSTLFEPFTQADGSITRRFGGTGLGLAISKRLVTLMGGSIDCANRSGGGSTFWFEVPLIRVNSAERPSSMMVGTDSLHGRRALIVDDNATNREILEHVLGAWGMRHVSAHDAHDALRLLTLATAHRDPFAVAILDRDMPDVDGLELSRRIRAQPQFANIRLLMLSSVSNTDSASTWRALGIDHYLTKPVRHAALFRTLCLTLGPRAPLEAPQESMLQTGKGSKSPGFGVHVLLAEDNAINQLIAEEVLVNLGCSVAVVTNGHAAVTAATAVTNPFAVILMDCEMPDLDGRRATQIIRSFEAQHPTRQRIPIIALTGHALDRHREECLAVGMDDYLSKPFSANQLAEVLARWIKPEPRSVIESHAA